MSAQGQSSDDLDRPSLRTSGHPEARQALRHVNIDLQIADHEESDGDNSLDATSLFDLSQGDEHVDRDPSAWEFVVHFHNFRLDHFPSLDTMLLDCRTEIIATRDIWRQVVDPILYDLEEIIQSKTYEASEASFVAMARELKDTLDRISRLGRELIRTLFRVHATICTMEINLMRALGRADEIPVEPLAWICLLYVWGWYRAFYWRLVHDLLPILHDWHIWAWPHPGAWAYGLRLVAFLVRQRMARLQFDHPWVDPMEYMTWVWDFCPDAADWLDDGGVEVDGLLPSGEEL